MLKLHLVVLVVCLQLFLSHCYTLNHFQRSLWNDFDGEINDELLAKIYQAEQLYNDGNPLAIGASIDAFDQAEGHPRGLQKRGRQCLWKVCSWALDKRSAPSNSIDSLSKLLY